MTSNYPQFYNQIDLQSHYITRVIDSSNDYTPCFTNKTVTSGKWYWEFTILQTNTYEPAWGSMFGVAASPNDISVIQNGATDFTTASTPYSHLISSNSLFYNNGVSSSSGVDFYNGAVIGVALDITNLQVTFYKNGVQVGTAQTIEVGQEWIPLACLPGPLGNTAYYKVNFGQLPFEYPAPAGFLCICDKNLPAPTITKPTDHFSVIAYEGNAAARTFSNLAFDPGLVILIKKNDPTFYNNPGNRHVYDTQRGANSALYTNTNASSTYEAQGLTAFVSGGFSLGTSAEVNGTNGQHYAMCWATAASDTQDTNGSITSSVRANLTSGTSTVKYIGTGQNDTVGHGLNVAPSLILVKDESWTESWRVWHKSIGADQYLGLEGEYGNPTTDATAWNSTAPTSTVFSIGTSLQTNYAFDSYTAYCFAEVEGFSKAGRYLGESDYYKRRKKIWLGFKPEVIWIKAVSGTPDSSTSSGTWWWNFCGESNYNFFHTSNLNPSYKGEYPRLRSHEPLGFTRSNNYTDGINVLSNGFEILPAFGKAVGYTGYEYIYFAWAKAPEKYARSGV